VSVSGAGDVNDDGYADMFIGSSDTNAGGIRRGEAYLVFGAAVTVNEGAQASVAGAFADPGDDVVTITASVGTITQTGTQNGTWSWTFDAADGTDQSQSVTITATDSDGAQSTVTFNLRV